MSKPIKILALLGSGEFTPAMAAVDRQLFKLTGKTNPIVAILPTAAGQEPNAAKWIQDGVSHMSKLGARLIGLEVFSREQANQPDILAQVKTADIIYFSGGDPGYLNKVLDGSKLWTAINQSYQAGKVIAASSAGAMVMGNYVFANPYQSFEGDKEPPRWEPALGLVNYAVLPHYDYMVANLSPEMKTLWQNTPAKIKSRWLGIEEDTALIIQDDQALPAGKQTRVMGKGAVSVTNGQTRVYKSGQTFTMPV